MLVVVVTGAVRRATGGAPTGGPFQRGILDAFREPGIGVRRGDGSSQLARELTRRHTVSQTRTPSFGNDLALVLTKPDDSQAVDLVRHHDAGMSQRALAAKYGVSRDVLRGALRRGLTEHR